MSGQTVPQNQEPVELGLLEAGSRAQRSDRADDRTEAVPQQLLADVIIVRSSNASKRSKLAMSGNGALSCPTGRSVS
jgi:hypothetical protein